MKTYFGTIEQLQNNKFPEKINQPKINHSYNKTIAKAQFSKQRRRRYSQKYIFLIMIKKSKQKVLKSEDEPKFQVLLLSRFETKV